MIYLSNNAVKQLESLKKEASQDDTLLRINIKKGGCSGLSYKMDFTDSISENDEVFDTEGSKVVVDKQSLLYVLGMTLDYEGGLNGKGFIFINPNAKKSCGCGSSFTT